MKLPISTQTIRFLILAVLAYVAYNALMTPRGPHQIMVGGASQGMTAPYLPNSQVQDVVPGLSADEAHMQSVRQDQLYKTNGEVMPYPQISNNFAEGNFKPSYDFAQFDANPKDQVTPDQLLPREGGFAASNPQVPGHLMQQNFLESGYHGGINTSGGSKRYANRQLRSDPLIPRRDVGPWNQSTIQADTNRRAFDIGSA